MMARKRNLDAAIERMASHTVQPAIEDRFARAQATLADRPTGFAAPTSDTPLPSTFTGESGSRNDAHHLASKYGSPVSETWRLAETDDNPYGARQIYLQADIVDLALKLKRDGQLVRALGTYRHGRRVLIDGGTRKRALKYIEQPTIEVDVFPNVSDQDLSLLSGSVNEDRSQHSAYDNALSWRKVLDDGIFASETELAEKKGKDLATVNKTLAILQLSESVQSIVRENPSAFGMSILYELLQLSNVAPPSVVVEQTQRVLQGELSRRELIDLRAKYAAPRARKTKEMSRQYKILGTGGAAEGTIKEWDNGRVTLDITLASPEARVRLVEELKARFSEKPE